MRVAPGGAALARAALRREASNLYSLHMQKVTATEARKRWFRLLDEVVDGEVVVERRGRRVVLRREDGRAARGMTAVPDYRKVLQVPRADEADRWSWAWQGPGRLRPLRRACA